jgi:hypothetical protein
MKKLLIQLSVLSVLVLVSFVLVLTRADGYTDPFYTRFTTPKQNNLILGTSRAAQGVQPGILDSIFEKDFYNYSFTIAHSPFGPTYMESIKKKLDQEKKDGIFIITADPWSISSTSELPNDSLNFRELHLCLANTPHVDRDPNFMYLFRNLKGNYKDVLFRKKSGLYLHDNGWLEVSIKMDSVKTRQRIADRVDMYKTQNLPYYQFSSLRLDYLKRTIQFLNQHGEVFLVRLPLHPHMMAIDDQLMPDFNLHMKQLAPLTRGYLDMTVRNEEFSYTDGNHLYK